MIKTNEKKNAANVQTAIIDIIVLISRNTQELKKKN